jgi:hypothetical protein
VGKMMNTRIAITQPNFLPWLGYFDLLDSVDFFVVLDDAQSTKQSFIVRNRFINHLGKEEWLTLNTVKAPHQAALNSLLVSRQNPWWSKMKHRLELAYASHPFWQPFGQELAEQLVPQADETVATYNWRLICWLRNIMGFTPLKHCFSSTLNIDAASSAETKIVKICQNFRANNFYNFKNGVDKGLHNPMTFGDFGIELFKQVYQHPQYPQYQSDIFIEKLSIIDLIFNIGSEKARHVIKLGSNWERTNKSK